jgi:outer membrane murein-binding lipoprotein Lpp
VTLQKFACNNLSDDMIGNCLRKYAEGDKMERLVVFSMIGALVLSGCASGSKDIGAAYISPIAYDSYSCDQVASEQSRISLRVAQLAGQVDSRATGDAVAMGVGLILFWPALFFLKGNGPEATEYARLKGEYEAVQQVSVRKNCTLPAPAVASAAPANGQTATPVQ